jgi:cytochrome c-type biogenesis protein CcmH
MTRTRRPTALFFSIASVFTLASNVPANAQVDRAKQIGGKFMCMCGCNQVLTQCNHVGCTTSTAMLKGLDQAVARGDSEDVITQRLVQEFGTKVYAEPPKSGLSLVAWILPGVYLLGGTLLVIFIILRWRSRVHLEAAVVGGGPSGISSEQLEHARRRVARETED